MRICSFVTVLTAALCFTASTNCEVKTIEIKNPLSWIRTHGSVTISRGDLGIDENETVVGLTVNRNEYSWAQQFQLDDLDGDGRWDELFFLAYVGANETVTANVTTRIVPVEPKTFDRRVNALIDARPREPWVVYKPVWESELMGYVTYGAAQIDVIGKTYPRLVTDYYFGSESHSPHEFTLDYGFDFLHTGNTMALHAVFVLEADRNIRRPWTTNAYSVNTKIKRDARYDSQVIADGPLRAIVRQWIAGWVTDMGRYACEITYSITALQRHTDIVVTFTEFPGRKKDLQIGAGMLQMYEDIHYEKTERYMTAVAENVYNRGMTARLLGRAIITTSQYKTEELHIPNDPDLTDMPVNGPNYGLLFPKGEITLKYAFVGAWDMDGGIESREQWLSYLNRLAQEIEKPLVVRVRN